MRWIILFFVFFIPLGFCIEADISCPEEVYYDNEFVCDVLVNDVDDIYDLKVYIKGGGVGINKIWDGSDWQRANWYVKNIIDSDGTYDIQLIIHKEFIGTGMGEFKVRKTGTSNILFEESFELNVLGDEGYTEETDGSNEEEDVETKDEKEEDALVVTEDEGRITNEKIIIEGEEGKKKIEENGTKKSIFLGTDSTSKKVIKLNSQDDFEGSEQVIYESKNEKIMNSLVYGLVLFLICIVGVLLYERK